MVIVIFAAGIFLGFSLGFATMALKSARDYRLQCQEVRETRGQLVYRYSSLRRFNPNRRRASGSSYLVRPGA
jgi:hypothetical protein